MNTGRVKPMSERILFNILEISLTMSVLIAILLILFPVLDKRFTAKWRYIVWLFLAVRLLIPVNVSLPSAPFSLSAPQFAFTYPNTALTTPSYEAPDRINPPQTAPVQATDIERPRLAGPQAGTAVKNPVPEKNISLTNPFIMVWLLGMLAFTAYLFFTYGLFRKSVLRWCRPVKQKRIINAWEEIRSEMGIRGNISLMVCKKVRGPMMTGFFRPVVLLPHEDYGGAALPAVLRHELTHRRRFDLWYKLLLKLAQAVHWFNPLVWLMVRAAERDIEASCDEAVVHEQDMSYRLRYCEAVLSSAQDGWGRNTAFSTSFSGGKKSMQQRLTSILDMGKRKKGTAALCLSVFLIFASGMLIACASPDGSVPFEPGTVYARNSNSDMVISYDAGNSYSLDAAGNVIISYHNGEIVTKAPLALHADDANSPGMQALQTGFYISAQKTAIAYGGNDAPIQVLISDDMGKTWNTYEVAGSEYKRDTKIIGFITKDDGWLVASPGSALGTAKNDVYLTSDGGKTWTETGNPNDLYPCNMTGAGFSTKEIGFIGYRVDALVGPTIYWTQDAGKTWAKYEMETPAEFDEYTKTPMSPVFWGAKGLWPISLRKNDSVYTTCMTSGDYGRTWVYDDSVLSKGKTIPFTLKAENKDWIRAAYLNAWDDPLYRERFPDSSVREEAARHVLFEMPASASTSSYFFTNIGFDPQDNQDDLTNLFGPGDSIKSVGLLLLNARIKSVKVMDDQVALVAEPADTGYQVILLDRDDLPGGNAQIRLVAPDGRGLDYLPVQ